LGEETVAGEIAVIFAALLGRMMDSPTDYSHDATM
jgi:hypothetical protein